MLTRLWNASAPLTATAGLMLIALAIAVAGLAIDPRIITGAPAWLKPAKFAVSVAIYSATLAWFFTLIPEWTRTRRIVGWVTAVALVLEIVIIDIQAFRGTTSHFNVATPLDTVFVAAMGILILVQTLASIAVAVAFWRHRFADASLGWALRLGMTITIIGAMSGGLMTKPTNEQLANARAGQRMTTAGAHTVGGADGGPGLLGTGWSTQHGDLRVAHFAGLHAMQALPILALILRRRQLSGTVRTRLTLTAAASYTGLFVILLTQALRGQSALTPDAVTLTVLVAWGATTAIAAAASLLRPVRGVHPVLA